MRPNFRAHVSLTGAETCACSRLARKDPDHRGAFGRFDVEAAGRGIRQYSHASGEGSHVGFTFA